VKTISIVIPAYNEADTVRRTYEAVTEVMRRLADRYAYEIVFTDNHSTDGTDAILADIAAADPRVRVARFSKNFGLQASIFAGYALSSGDAAIQLDCDLQDPPELIPEFVAAWERGYQVVYGVRRSRQEGRSITAARRLFYRLLSRLGTDELPLDAGEFRLVDRALIREMTKFADYHPFLRTSIAWMGFRQTGIAYDRAPRAAGRSKFSLWSLLGFALDGIVAHSIAPLRIATALGVAIGAISVVAAILVFVAGLFLGARRWLGMAGLALLTTISLSVNAILLGVIGEYLGRLYVQSKGRPLVIIEATCNLTHAPSAIRAGDSR
jgi:glycosyltransferase involved in cell wall biosynthesis